MKSRTAEPSNWPVFKIPLSVANPFAAHCTVPPVRPLMILWLSRDPVLTEAPEKSSEKIVMALEAVGANRRAASTALDRNRFELTFIDFILPTATPPTLFERFGKIKKHMSSNYVSKFSSN